jgi:uncharacterized protein with HEPN domain
MSKRNFRLLLEDIKEATENILEYTAEMNYDSFCKDKKTKDAVVRNFEVIGEASNRVPTEIQTEYPTVPWRRMIGFRNRIIHEYFGIDFQILWQIIQDNIPDLLAQINEVIISLKSHKNQL